MKKKKKADHEAGEVSRIFGYLFLAFGFLSWFCMAAEASGEITTNEIESLLGIRALFWLVSAIFFMNGK